MNKMKYEILLRVHTANANNHVTRSDFYHDTKNINQYRQCINELIASKYLSESIGSDVLTITAAGVDALETEQDILTYRSKERNRYWITTVIALFALLLSVISLLNG